MKSNLAGLGKKERSQLGTLLKARAPAITPEFAASSLKVDRSRAAQLLARWSKKGWLSRVKRGVYLPITLQSDTTQVMVDEPWLLAKSLFSPCYIGGWSAAEHWDFTEQIFSSAMIFTAKKVAAREINLNGARYTLKTIKPERIFGLQSIWIENQKVEISDPTRTIVDAFNDPATIGGIRMASDALARYMRSEHKNLNLLFDYGLKLNNTASFKRLGFIFSTQYSLEKKFIEKARKVLKSGYSQLDPAVPGKSLVTEWGLWVPKGFRNVK